MQQEMFDINDDKQYADSNVVWKDRAYVVVDLEGTGAQHREKEGIVEIAIVHIRNGQIDTNIYERRFNPGITIPPWISRIHGIRNSDVDSLPSLEEHENELLRELGEHALVAHNASVERRLLGFRLPRLVPHTYLDTMRLAHCMPGSDWTRPSLDALIGSLELQPHLDQLMPLGKRHSAGYDALATALAFTEMIEKLNPEMTVKELYQACSI